MNKKIVSILISIIPVITFAQIQTEYGPNEDPFKGLPKADSGVVVTESSKINIPEKFKIKSLKETKDMNKYGYILSDSTDARELMNFKMTGPEQVRLNATNTNPYDTHLKANANDIKLAFEFKGISSISNKNIIGYAPIGSWVNNGWTGIKTIFNDPTLGTCEMSYYNIALSHGGALLDKDNITHAVNKKPTVTYVAGNPTNGFMYTVSWYDNASVHDFNCASKSFNPNIIPEMIKLSKNIDKDLSTH